MAYRVGYSFASNTLKGVDMKINTPTKITITRIVLVVALLVYLGVCAIFSYAGNLGPTYLGNSSITVVGLISAIVFIVASATDALDGYLARKNNQVTDLGKFLDPIADKMLVNSMLIFFAFPWSFTGGYVRIPVFCVILMVLRDLVVDTLRFVAASKNEVIAANIFGKLKTIFQMVALPFIMLNDFPFSYFDSSWPMWVRPSLILVYLATAMSLLSGIIYVIQNAHVLKDKKDEVKTDAE